MFEIQRFGGTGATNIHPAAFLLMVAAFLLIFLLPQRYIIGPLLATALLLPLGQKVVVAGLDLMMFRIVFLFGWLRLIGGGLVGYRECRPFRTNIIDKLFILWTFSSVITFTILWSDWEAFINRMGFLYNALGIYFLIRFLCRNAEDIDRIMRVFAIICAVVAASMLNEQFTGRNLFSVFGGVPELSAVRAGHVRAQGPFGHSILAGTFGATLFPLFVGLWWQRNRDRFMALLGIVSATSITIASMSSTPFLAYLAAVIGLCLWPFRKQLRILGWAIVFCLVGLHMIMKAPVWALVGRVNVIGGSSGYHRYLLVDACIKRFSEWWLLGTKSSSHWGWMLGDTANAFVETAVTGGLITLILFLATLVYCFKGLGLARKRSQGQVADEWRVWALGAALFSNVAAFFGIVYFDQTLVAWYALLAMISAATSILPNVTVPSSSPRTVKNVMLARSAELNRFLA